MMGKSAMGPNRSIISFQDVSFTYEGAARKALDGITFDVREGEFVCLLGGNGSGKTTLAKMINGLLVPESGSVFTCGLNTADSSNLNVIRQYAGMVFQNPDDQMVGNFVEDDVAFGPENLLLFPSEIQERVEASLKQVGLQSFGRRQTRSLSGGQKQRVAIAGALAMRPKILVLDEAASMLDPRGRTGLLKACKNLNENGLTVVYVTHFLDEAVAADTIVVMREGKVAITGKPSEVLENHEALRELHLDTPFAVKVCDALKREGVPIHIHLRDEGLVDELSQLGFSSSSASEEASGAASMNEGEYRADGAAILKLQNVCYSYLDKRLLKKALRSEMGSADVSGSGRNEGKRAHAKAKWGSDPEAIWAVNDLSLSIREGDFLGIAGHTGSGKSTLLRILAGLVRPTSGEVLIDGYPASSRNGMQVLRESVGIVMQYPEKQLFAQTVFEDCAFGPRNLGLAEQEVEERVSSALRLVGFGEERIWQKSPFQLSGGQQRRVAIGGVLAMRPKILILDEPTAGLDPAGCKSVLRLIRKMHGQYGVTTIMVSHNMDSIAHLCNKVLVLNRGREFCCGSPIDVFSNGENLRKIGLGLPASLQLANSLEIKGFNHVPKIEQLSKAIIAGLPSAQWIGRQEKIVGGQGGASHE